MLLLCNYLRHPFHSLSKQTCVALHSRCLDTRESLQGRTFLQPVNQACTALSSSLCLLISPPPLKRSLRPHSPSRLSKPDYWLSIQTQSLLLIRTNLLVIEHTSSLLRPAKTGVGLPRTIIHVKCLSSLSFPGPCLLSVVAAQLPSRSPELLNSHNQPSGTTQQ